MLERTPCAVAQTQTSSPITRSRLGFAVTLAATMMLPHHDTHETASHERVMPSVVAPLLAELPRDCNLLGIPFRITEDGSVACLKIEGDRLVLELDGEQFIVQKIYTDMGLPLELTPACISACGSFASLSPAGEAVVGRVRLPFACIESRMEQQDMAALAEELQASDWRQPCTLVWRDRQGNPRGSATLVASPRRTTLASR
jgi:hypothetical protein